MKSNVRKREYCLKFPPPSFYNLPMVVRPVIRYDSLRFVRSGTWSDDKASGVGRLEYSNGDAYEGQWERDQRHGEYRSLLYFAMYASHIVSPCWSAFGVVASYSVV